MLFRTLKLMPVYRISYTIISGDDIIFDGVSNYHLWRIASEFGLNFDLNAKVHTPEPESYFAFEGIQK